MARIFRKYEEPEVAPKAPTPPQKTSISMTSDTQNETQQTERTMNIHPDIIDRVQKSISPAARIEAQLLFGKSINDILPGFAPAPRVVTLYQPWMAELEKALSAYQMALQPVEGGAPGGLPIKSARPQEVSPELDWQEQALSEEGQSRMFKPQARDVGAPPRASQAVAAQSTTGSGTEIFPQEGIERPATAQQRPGSMFSPTSEGPPGLPTARARMADPSQAMFPGTPPMPLGRPATAGTQSVTGRETFPVQRPQPVNPPIKEMQGPLPGSYVQQDLPIPSSRMPAGPLAPGSFANQEGTAVPHPQPNPARVRGGSPLGQFSQVYGGFTDSTPGVPYSSPPSSGGAPPAGGNAGFGGGTPPAPGGGQPPPSLAAPKPPGVPSLSLAGAPPHPGTQGIGGSPRPTGMAIGPSGQPTGVGGGGSPMPAKPSIGGFNRSLPESNDLYRAASAEEDIATINRMLGVSKEPQEKQKWPQVRVRGSNTPSRGGASFGSSSSQKPTIGAMSRSLGNIESLFSMM